MGHLLENAEAIGLFLQNTLEEQLAKLSSHLLNRKQQRLFGGAISIDVGDLPFRRCRNASISTCCLSQETGTLSKPRR